MLRPCVLFERIKLYRHFKFYTHTDHVLYIRPKSNAEEHRNDNKPKNLSFDDPIPGLLFFQCPLTR